LQANLKVNHLQKPVRSSLGRFAVQIITPRSPAELGAIHQLLNEYAASLSIDLCFQDFEAELRDLPGVYAAPRGGLLAAYVNQSLAGCCALRPLDTVDYANSGEMKRLYVRPNFRKYGVGRQLAEAILDTARSAGYNSVLLDTLSDMETARGLYHDLGFKEIPPYYHNPIQGAHYLKVDL
jgi:putative acetyltransferase